MSQNGLQLCRRNMEDTRVVQLESKVWMAPATIDDISKQQLTYNYVPIVESYCLRRTHPHFRLVALLSANRTTVQQLQVFVF
jgi:hypothetical protein